MIKVYINSTCPLCMILIGILKYNNIDFKLINIDEDENGKDELLSKLCVETVNNIAFPVIIDEDTNKILIGYEKEELEEIVKKKIKEPSMDELKEYLPPIDLEKVRNYYNVVKKFAEYSGYYLNPDLEYVYRILDAQLKNEKNGIKTCPCKLGNVPCPCSERDREIEIYDHCFCGLYVSRRYIENWRPENTLKLLSNRHILNYDDIPDNVDGSFVKIYIRLNNVFSEKNFIVSGNDKNINNKNINNGDFNNKNNNKINIKNNKNSNNIDDINNNINNNDNNNTKIKKISSLFNKIYKLGNRGYGYIENHLLKFKSEVGYYDTQIWYKSIDDYLDNNLDIANILDYNYDFEVSINKDIVIPPSKCMEINFKNTFIKTNYPIDNFKRRYIINGENKKEIIKVLDNIIDLEGLTIINNKADKLYKYFSKKIRELQKEVDYLIETINLDHNREEYFESHLINLSETIKHTSEFQEKVVNIYSLYQYHISKKLENNDFKDLLNKVSYHNKHESIIKDFEHLLQQLDILKTTLNEIIEILETNVIISQNSKTLKLQDEIHKTAKTQLNMHKVIEGLYVIFAAFYFTELALIVFEGTKHAHILEYDPYIMASLFIPIAIILGVVISKKLKKGIDD